MNLMRNALRLICLLTAPVYVLTRPGVTACFVWFVFLRVLFDCIDEAEGR